MAWAHDDLNPVECAELPHDGGTGFAALAGAWNAASPRARDHLLRHVRGVMSLIEPAHITHLWDWKEQPFDSGTLAVALETLGIHVYPLPSWESSDCYYFAFSRGKLSEAEVAKIDRATMPEGDDA